MKEQVTTFTFVDPEWRWWKFWRKRLATAFTYHIDGKTRTLIYRGSVWEVANDETPPQEEER